MRDQIKQVLAGVFDVPVDEITDETSPETLEGWDSLRHLELVLELELSFGVRVPTSRVAELLSVSEIEETMRELLGS